MSEPLPALPEYCWPVDWACCPDYDCTYSLDVIERSEALAAQTMRALTGGRVGGCPVMVRPCRSGGCLDYLNDWYWSRGTFTPVITADGDWVNCSCGCADRADCSCTALCKVALPGPVGLIESVQVGSQVIPPEWYTVIDSDLVWIGDGSPGEECGWPLCQDLAAPLGHPNTFGVTYVRGAPVDALGAYAAGLLACEFAKACTGQACRLPYNVTSISRQGVSMQIAPTAFTGSTGIPQVDSYVEYWNPGRLRQRPLVRTPSTVRTGASR